MPWYQITEIWHFFNIYEALEPGKSSETRGWEKKRDAIRAVEEAQRRFAERGALTAQA